MSKFDVYKLSSGNWKRIGGKTGDRSEIVKKMQQETGQANGTVKVRKVGT